MRVLSQRRPQLTVLICQSIDRILSLTAPYLSSLPLTVQYYVNIISHKNDTGYWLRFYIRLDTK